MFYKSPREWYRPNAWILHIEAFSWHSLVTLVPLFCAVTFILWWNTSILMGVVSSRITIPSSTGHKGSRNGLSVKMMSLSSHYISTHLNTYQHWRVRQSSAPPLSKQQMDEYVFLEWFYPSSRVPETFTSMPRHVEAVLVTHGDPTPY